MVHHRGAFVHLADLVGPAGVEEDALGRGGLARVDVGHDPDVAGLFEGKFACQLAIHDAGSVEGTADDLVADARQVSDPAAAHEHDRVLLQVVADAGDVYAVTSTLG